MNLNEMQWLLSSAEIANSVVLYCVVLRKRIDQDQDESTYDFLACSSARKRNLVMVVCAALYLEWHKVALLGDM